jgi:TIR domain-containing protein
LKIFISWSGQRSKAAAEALRDWLVRVIQRLEPWVSSEDIRAGARWQIEIAGVLSNTKVGILCLTPENLHSDWLHFEAGALAKTIDNSTFVCPYLISLDPADVPLPLGQFQAKRADFEGTRSLVRTINEALGESALAEAQLNDAFDTYWPRLKEILDSLPAPEGQTTQRRDPVNMLEEILDIVRGLAREKYTELDEEGPEGFYSSEESLSAEQPRAQVIDLMAALRASLAATEEQKEQKKRKTTNKRKAPNKGAAPDANRAPRGRRR